MPRAETLPDATATAATSAPTRAPWVGLGIAVAVVLAAFLVPWLADWQVYTRKDGSGVPPLHGYWEVKVGLGTIPALVLAGLSLRYAAPLADRLPWQRLVLVSFLAGLAWLFSLAYVDGSDGISRVLGNAYEYLPTARAVDDTGATIREFISRIPYSAKPDNWPTHIAGHPVGALLVFVGFVRLGLGDDWVAGAVVTVAAATIPLAVLSTLRTLGGGAGESAARRAAPFLVLTPAAMFLAVSADALFAAVAAWGIALLARAAVAPAWRGVLAWGVPAGLLLGGCVLLSYGLPLLGVLAVAVLVAARSWRPLPVAVVAALVPVLVLAALGFAWWEAYPVLVDRYHEGVASDRPAAYWWWGNLGALLVATGPALGAGLAVWATRAWGALRPVVRREGSAETATADRALLLLVGAGVAMVALADASGMSKAEVERIWLPFMPWLALSFALLPRRWRAPALAAQLAVALLVQHLLYTSW